MNLILKFVKDNEEKQKAKRRRDRRKIDKTLRKLADEIDLQLHQEATKTQQQPTTASTCPLRKPSRTEPGELKNRSNGRQGSVRGGVCQSHAHLVSDTCKQA